MNKSFLRTFLILNCYFPLCRHNHPEFEIEKVDKIIEDNNNEITIDYRGEKISKSRYFFGDILHKSSGPSSGTSANSGRAGAKSRLGFLKEDRQQKGRKTAVDLFLEDAGPYSRKLYGPPPSKESSKEKTKSNKRARSQELIPEVNYIFFCFGEKTFILFVFE